MGKFEVYIPNHIKEKAVHKLATGGKRNAHIPTYTWEDPKVSLRCLNGSAPVTPFVRNMKGAWTS